MTRVVVTGGCGFVGSHLVERLIAAGDDVTIFDTVVPPADQALARAHARCVVGDIRDLEQLSLAITPQTATVYHLAAVVGVDQYLTRPLDVVDINFCGSRNVLELAAKAGAAAVIASTSEVFGKNPAVPWREDSDRVLGPTSADRWTYSTSKALAEHLTFAFARQHALPASIVRYFNVYGPRQRPAYVISRNVHRVLNGLAPVVYDDGNQTRCFTYVADAVDGTVRAGAAPGPVDVFNIGSMEETTVAEAVAAITKLTGYESDPAVVDTATRLGTSYQDLARRMPDNTRARTVLGWECGTSLITGLAQTIEWAKASPWWLAFPDQGA